MAKHANKSSHLQLVDLPKSVAVQVPLPVHGSYDFLSIMHYKESAFSACGGACPPQCRSMTVKSPYDQIPGIQSRLGGNEISYWDTFTVRQLYGSADCDGNGQLNAIGDALNALNFQFVPAFPDPPCVAQCDADGDHIFNGLGDGLYILSFNFAMGPAPPPPFPTCGFEAGNPTIDAIGCTTPVCP